MKMLVAYYSWSNGNTERIAKKLAERKGADLQRIETEEPYEGSREEVVEQGKRETEEGYMPSLKPVGKRAGDYEVIAVGTPVWWYTMAPAVHSYLEAQDFAGKTVIPFVTSAGWPGHAVRDMERIIREKGGKAAWPMKVRFDSEGGSAMVTREEEIDAWIERIRL